jgi:hypothetical protein
MGSLAFLAQSSSSSGGSTAGTVIGIVIGVAIAIFMIAALWAVFEKAGHKGWMAIIPILNTYVVIRIANRPGWWILLMLIPCVSIVVAIIVYIDLAKEFGKSAAYGVGMILLPFIFIPMLGWGSAQYQGGRPGQL